MTMFGKKVTSFAACSLIDASANMGSYRVPHN